jgi:DNA-binding CsgD family transcriptional regulator/tetratricopeptide (TPR) repeat protein
MRRPVCRATSLRRGVGGCAPSKSINVTANKRKPELQWLPDFMKARAESRFKDASEIYDKNATGAESLDLVLAGARVHTRFQPSEVIRLLIDVDVPVRMHREAVERDVLLGEAFARTDDFDSADERLNAALARAEAIGDDDLAAEVAYRFIRRHLRSGNPSVARQYLEIARKGPSLASRLNALHAEAFILDVEERVKEEAGLLIELLRSIDPISAEFMHHRAWGTEALAILARDLFIPQALPEIERQLDGLPWTADFAANLFQTLKALGWAKAMQGDYFNAFRHLKRASSVITSDAWKVVAACDRSYLARSNREPLWSRQELDEAEQIAERVVWHATLGEERVGLLLLAELFSGLDPSKSAMYLARYRQLGDVKSALHNKHDARTQAYLRFSTGVVEIALGNKKRGLLELREASKVFDRFGYDFRSARCLIAESEASGNRDLLPIAAEKLRNYAQSWLAIELRGSPERPDGIALPPAQKRVLDEVFRGKSTAEIADTLGRSEFTVNNHLREIFKAFNVKSRSALFVEAMRRGLIGTP